MQSTPVFRLEITPAQCCPVTMFVKLICTNEYTEYTYCNN